MKKQNYAPEIRDELVRLAAQGHSVVSLARDYEPSAATMGARGFQWTATKRIIDGETT